VLHILGKRRTDINAQDVEVMRRVIRLSTPSVGAVRRRSPAHPVGGTA
jgi:hypothetical protein